MPDIRETLRSAAARLEAAGVPEPVNDAALLLSHVTGEPPLSLRADAGRPLGAETLAAFEALLAGGRAGSRCSTSWARRILWAFA